MKNITLMRRFICGFFFCLTCLCGVAQATNLVLEDSTAGSGYQLFLSGELLEDPSGELSFDQVLNGDHTFRSIKDGSLAPSDIQQGFSRSAFWLKVTIANKTYEQRWFIQAYGSQNKTIDAYLKSTEEQTFTKLSAVDGFLGTVFNMTALNQTSHTLYFRVQDNQTPVDLALYLFQPNAMLYQTRVSYVEYAAVFGGLLALAIYNLFYFVYLRDRGFLALSVFVAAFMLELGNHLGIWGYFKLTSQYLHYVGTAFGFIAIASLIVFFNNLLELKVNTPRGYVFLRAAFWVCVALTCAAPFVSYGVAVIAAVSLVLVPAVLIICITLYLRGYKFLNSMVLAAFVFLGSVTPALLSGMGIVSIYSPLIFLSTPGLLVALVLMSLTQAEQVQNKSKQAERTLASNQAKDEFLTTMSHELRTPMNAVVGAGRLLAVTKLVGEQRELVSRLNNSSSHMLSLINDILDLARAETHLATLEKKPFKLAEVIESLEQLLHEATESKQLSLILKNHFMPFRQELVGDVTRLKQILLNLLNNAIKFTEQGHVRLTITPKQFKANQVRLLFEVSDTGIGIAKDKQQDLFKPFTQVDSSISRRYGGSGLGLAISSKLVKLMGGELAVDSKPNQGSCFYFSIDIPLQGISVEVEEVKPAKPSLTQVNKLHGFRVLLVDDDEMNLFFGEKLLTSCGVSVTVADSGEAALSYLQHQRFDLMLLDVSMPGMNGYQTVQAVRSQNKLANLTVVALTAHAIAGERERCLAAGMDDFMTKPFELSDLQEMLLKHAAEHIAAQQVSSS